MHLPHAHRFPLAGVFVVGFVVTLGCGDPPAGADEGGSDETGQADSGGDDNDCAQGCLIAAVCHDDGDVRPGSSCQVCDVATANDAWTDRDGEPCDDGLFCNGADTCSAGSCSIHAGDPCGDDGVFCNGGESCSEDADACESSGNPCGAGESCFEPDGLCCSQGAELGCDADGNIVELDSCGRIGPLVAACPDLPNGICEAGSCGCTPGFGGPDCDRCVVYVSGDEGDDADDGTSWGSAKATIQAGIDAAEPGQCQVWVASAQTAYRPTSGTGRDATIQLRTGVDVYGGYREGAISDAQRDWVSHETTISGDLGVAGVADDNACHVVTLADGASIDGFSITAGMADAACAVPDRGGGMLGDVGNASVAHCTLAGNHAAGNGGALSLDGATVVAVDVTFDANVAAADGGAVAVASGTLEVTGARFTGNQSGGHGGAVAIGDQGSATLTRAILSDNEAAGDGGAIDTAECSGELSLINSVVHSNYAGGGGGGLALGTYGTVLNTVIALNEAGVYVGGLATFECHPDSTNNIVWGNTSPDGVQGDVDCSASSHDDIGGSPCAGVDGNIDADPRFVNTDPTQGPIDLSLQPGSPCIDAGYDDVAPFADLLGRDRYDDPATANCPTGDPQAPACGWISDLGAYEYSGLQ